MGTRRYGRIGPLVDQASNPPDGYHAAWNATTQQWEPTEPPTGGGGPHATSHQNNGADEISVAGLSGLLADPQTPAAHGHAQSEVTGLVTALAGKATPGDISAAVSTHEGASDPHPTYTTAAEAASAAGAAVSAHEAAADPHTGYQLKSEKAAASGYASLGADGKVPSAQLPASSGGGATYGKTVLDFGAFPGGSDASVTVTGQSGIAAASIVSAWLRPEATPDHTADEHMLETLRVFAGNIIAGTGFTLYGINDSQQHEPLMPGGSGRAATAVVGAQADDGSPRIGGRGTRIWGRWTVAWMWA